MTRRDLPAPPASSAAHFESIVASSMRTSPTARCAARASRAPLLRRDPERRQTLRQVARAVFVEGTLREHQLGHHRAPAVTLLRTIPSSSAAFVPATSPACPRFPPRRSMVRRGLRFESGEGFRKALQKGAFCCLPAERAGTRRVRPRTTGHWRALATRRDLASVSSKQAAASSDGRKSLHRAGGRCQCWHERGHLL